MDALGLARFDKLQRPGGAPKKGDDPERVREAAKAFEAVFVHQVFKSMRATIQKSELTDGGYGEEIFTDMLDQEYAGIVSKRGLGLSDLLAEQLGAGEATQRPVPQRPQLDVSEPTLIEDPARIAALEAEEAEMAPARINPAQRRGLRGYQRQSRGAVQAPARGRVLEVFGGQSQGLDIAAPSGHPIHAAKAGVVRPSEDGRVILDHGGGLSTHYINASDLRVAPGQRVELGQAIARVHDDGDEPRLRFEVRRHGQALDPARFLGQPGLERGQILKHADANGAARETKRGEGW